MDISIAADHFFFSLISIFSLWIHCIMWHLAIVCHFVKDWANLFARSKFLMCCLSFMYFFPQGMSQIYREWLYLQERGWFWSTSELFSKRYDILLSIHVVVLDCQKAHESRLEAALAGYVCCTVECVRTICCLSWGSSSLHSSTSPLTPTDSREANAQGKQRGAHIILAGQLGVRIRDKIFINDNDVFQRGV